jgi:hypothetical protein
MIRTGSADKLEYFREGRDTRAISRLLFGQASGIGSSGL